MAGRTRAPVVTEPAVLTLADLVVLTSYSRRSLKAAAARGAIPGRIKAPPHARTRPHRYIRRQVEDWIERGMPGLSARRRDG
jgi:hypothetical protein